MSTIDALNLAFCRLRDIPACRYCDIPCDPSTREYRGAGVCEACYDLATVTVIKKGRRDHATK